MGLSNVTKNALMDIATGIVALVDPTGLVPTISKGIGTKVIQLIDDKKTRKLADSIISTVKVCDLPPVVETWLEDKGHRKYIIDKAALKKGAISSDDKILSDYAGEMSKESFVNELNALVDTYRDVIWMSPAFVETQNEKDVFIHFIDKYKEYWEKIEHIDTTVTTIAGDMGAMKEDVGEIKGLVKSLVENSGGPKVEEIVLKVTNSGMDFDLNAHDNVESLKRLYVVSSDSDYKVVLKDAVTCRIYTEISFAVNLFAHDVKEDHSWLSGKFKQYCNAHAMEAKPLLPEVRDSSVIDMYVWINAFGRMVVRIIDRGDYDFDER